MDIEITGYNELVGALKPVAADAGIIAVDVSGAGQSTIPGKLAGTLGCRRETLIGAESGARLKAMFKEPAGRGALIVEGVRLLELLRAAGVAPDVYVYVIPSRDNPRRKFWEAILSRPLAEYCEALPEARDREIVKYHHRYHPILNANFLVEGD